MRAVHLGGVDDDVDAAAEFGSRLRTERESVTSSGTNVT